MAHGKKVSEDVQWFIIHLSPVIPVPEIAMYANLNVRTVERILQVFRETGGVQVKDGAKELGKPNVHHTLCDYDIQASNLLWK
jgi:hypothetical protein